MSLRPSYISGGSVPSVGQFPKESSKRDFAYYADLIHNDGSLHRKAQLLRRVLVDDLGLKPRDIVAAFSKEARRGVDLNIRRRAVLISLGKDGPAVIVSGEAAWIVPRRSQSSRASSASRVSEVVQRHFLDLNGLDHSHSAHPTARRSRPLYGQLSEGTSELGGWTPFSLGVVEAVLIMFLERLTSNLQRTVAESAQLLEAFAATGAAEISTFQLELLRRTKQRLEYLRSQAKSLQQALFEALGDEDDMAELPEAVGATQEEWELCFEYYSHTAEEIALDAFRQLEGLEDLETSMSLSLSSRRLELEKLQIYLSVIDTTLTTGALLTGAFGMNLMSGLESRRLLFWPACGGIAAVSFGVFGALQCLIRRRLRQQGSALWVPPWQASRRLPHDAMHKKAQS